MKTLKAVYLVTVITGLLTGLSLSSSASAQDISGTWHGKLTVPTGSLTLVFHINQTGEGTYITTLDSPDQGANGIKTQTNHFVQRFHIDCADTCYPRFLQRKAEQRP